MARRGNKPNPAARALVLLAVVAVPLLFVLAIISTDFIVTVAPYLLIVLIAVVMGIYSGITSQLLYEYFEVYPPWYRWVPCFSELTLMDSKYLKIGTVFYALAVIFLGISRIPYSVSKMLGETIALSLPFYATVVAMLMLFAVQIVKGIGLLGCYKTVGAEWKEKMETSLGFIKTFSLLGFIPFVRVLAVYGLNKPLSTLVTFNDITVSDSDEVALEEEE